MTRGGSRLLVDVSQYARFPATSGVQRVLRHLAEDWPDSVLEARFGFIENDTYLTGPLPELGSVIASTFLADTRLSAERSPSPPLAVHNSLRARCTAAVPVEDVEKSFDAYLLPEPTLRKDNLAIAMRPRDTPSFFIFYDALPLTHPQYFSHGADRRGILTRYHRCLGTANNVAFISEAARRVFEERIARRKLPNGVVTRLGADGLRPVSQVQAETPMFVVVGTVERRKRHSLVLDAFEQMWSAGRDYRLLVLGPPGGEEPELFERLENLARTPRLQWIQRADDESVSNALARATALLFVSDAEGYGLPPLEALAAGCPVIASPGVPSLEGLSESGQIRLESLTANGVCNAVETLVDPNQSALKRRETRDLDLPTWRQFARTVAEWIASTLGSRT